MAFLIKLHYVYSTNTKSPFIILTQRIKIKTELILFSLFFPLKLVKEKENVLINKKDKVSPKFIANLNSQFDVRFNRLKSDKERLLLQEETAYEQQVQGRLNEIKLNSARQLNQLIQEQTEINKKNFELFVRSMFNFMLAQENDRLHMITVYKKLKAYFPDELVDREIGRAHV